MLQVRVQQKALVKALTKVNHACAKKSSLPVLEHVLLLVEGGTFTVQTTNLGVGMRVEMETDIEAEIVSDGEEYGVSVPCKALLKMAKSMPKDGILSIEETRKGKGKDPEIEVTMKDDIRSFELMGIDGGEFPKFGWPPNQNTTSDLSNIAFSIPADALLAGLGKARPFMETTDLRPILNGIQIVSDARKTDNLHFASADGYMLASIPLTAVISKELLDVVLGREAVEVLCKLLPKTEDIVTVYQNDNGLYFVVGNMSIVGQTIEGMFPNYKAIIPDSRNFTVTLDATEFLDELKRVSMVLPKGIGAFQIELSKSSMMVTAEAKNDGVKFSARLEVEECEIGDGEPISAFNVSYAMRLLSPASFAKGDKVTISWESHKYPLLFENASQDDGAKYVLMPMHIGR